jgi:hypothetical protein
MEESRLLDLELKVVRREKCREEVRALVAGTTPRKDDERSVARFGERRM